MIPDPRDTDRMTALHIHRRALLGSGAIILAAAGVDGQSPALAQVSASRPTEDDRRYMAEAIRQMRKAGVTDRTGEPFGAVIVRDGRIIAAAGNSVSSDADPTAHAEVNAIRFACKAVGKPDLQGATLYASCEPCPMCYSAAFWSRIGKIYYAAALTDYDDIWDDAGKGPTPPVCTTDAIPIGRMMREDAQAVWNDYRRMIGKPLR